ncbi:MAG: hypothetical protein HY900_27510, partial [Deltaproteobacteria bacterium]|nr:hypothetical protein [Deltaproteobacteria bacterium]
MHFPEKGVGSRLAPAALVAVGLGLAPWSGLHAAKAPAPEAYETFWQLTRSPFKRLGDVEAWRRAVPQVRQISIRSSADGSAQPAFFYNSGSARAKPLLVALHSWSEDYRQFQGIPYGRWAVRNDWVLIHPNYRGVFTNPKATGSEESIRDILDAVDYAKRNARID